MASRARHYWPGTRPRRRLVVVTCEAVGMAEVAPQEVFATQRACQSAWLDGTKRFMSTTNIYWWSGWELAVKRFEDLSS